MINLHAISKEKTNWTDWLTKQPIFQVDRNIFGNNNRMYTVPAGRAGRYRVVAETEMEYLAEERSNYYRQNYYRQVVAMPSGAGFDTPPTRVGDVAGELRTPIRFEEEE